MIQRFCMAKQVPLFLLRFKPSLFFLYGTGYLFALLFISHNLPPEVLPPLLEPICEMIFAIFAAGIATSKKWYAAIQFYASPP